MYYPENFDVIVVGAGHAGTEAALASARLGSRTLLLTHSIETLGQMSCNPAIGGIGKGHLVKEIDALGGAMAMAADLSGIQFRILNAKKGPAVRATRAQADRLLYKKAIRQMVETQPNLWLFQQAVDDLLLDQDRVVGVITQSGLRFRAAAVVLTVGTFLQGKIHIGDKTHAAGRAGDPPALALAEKLRALPLRVGRLKTGTPPRIDGRTINYAALQEQPGDTPTPLFSFWGDSQQHPLQVSCHITHTNKKTHEIIRQGLHRSPLFSGAIEGKGPRYCPSIEDKIVRFADKDSHQIFIEPEGLSTYEVYPNGISTSLPFDIQLELVRSMVGLEKAHITRPGYAIEYDFFDPRDLQPTLETKYVPGLFFAGQINGTTGYEEAASQGLLAGINAAFLAQGKPGWYPHRSEAYIGVLVDDLITAGTQEPYRMFTSRAEYRLRLREDNADLRLTSIGRKLGLISDEKWRLFEAKQEAILQETQRLKELWIRPNTDISQQISQKTGITLDKEYRALELLRRPEVRYNDLIDIGSELRLQQAVCDQVEIQVKYEGYIELQDKEIAKLLKNEHIQLPMDLNFQQISGLSAEVQEKLSKGRPKTLGHASRIPGVTPAAVSILLVYLKKQGRLFEMKRTGIDAG